MKIIADNRGITLLEVMLSLGIIAIILLPTLSIFAASITNNRVSQEAIEAKYAAEKYAEIIKSTRIDNLDTALTGTYGFSTSSVGIYTNAGVEISVSRFGNYRTSGDRSYDFDERILDISEIEEEITIDINDTTNGISITAGKSILVDGYDAEGDPQPYLSSKEYTTTSRALELRFNGDNSTSSSAIVINNLSGRKVTFYCVNQGKKENDTFFYANRTLPTFRIIGGEVAFCDLTVAPSDERLPEETDNMFKGDDEMSLSYKFTIRILNKNGICIYTLEGMKTIN